MLASRDPRLNAAEQALQAGDWSTAKREFEVVLAEHESPEALVGLGNALWWLQDPEASLSCHERAYAAFRRRRDPLNAAIVALRLSPRYSASLGNLAAARGWLGRAARLIEEFELTPLQGWVFLSRAAMASTTGDPHSGEGFARQALESARRFDDADLELCALSQIGGALVMMGKLEQGAPLLDEALAGALAGEGDPETVVHASCVNIVSCSRAAEIKRVLQWIRAADDFNRRYGSPHLDALCRTAYGEVLLATGRWAEAETELQAALDKMSRRAEPAVRTEALAKLAELRLAQGRIEDAARLLDGIADQIACVTAHALLSLARGELGVAASILRRRLREMSDTSVEAASLLELLIEVEIEQGAVDDATARARRLAGLGSRVSCDTVVARGERALGRVLIASNDTVGAVPHLERACETFARLELPFEVARTTFLLARALGSAEREGAIAHAQTALATFEMLGAARDADAAAAYLRSLGVKAARVGPRGDGGLTRRELEVLTLLGEGLSNRELAERLCLTRKTVENHVASVLAKLGLSGRAEAAAYAVRNTRTGT